MVSTPKANLFIIGAPKCGTTSLASWLSQHPDVFMSTPKEPRFFNTDWEFPFRPKTIEEYDELFTKAMGYSIIGEATTGYLSSKVAISNINNYNANAKFVVCLRNPIEMLVSLHAQRLKEGEENELSLESAWSKQNSRSQNKNIPINCYDKKSLMYGSICSIGHQVNELLKQVPRNKVQFHLLENLKSYPQEEFQKLLYFLNISESFTPSFDVKNKGKIPRSVLLSQVSRKLGRVKKKIGVSKNFGIQTIFNNLNGQQKKTSISTDFYTYLQEHFKDDILLLSNATRIDLSHWL